MNTKKRMMIVAGVLLVAILACNLPSGTAVSPAQGPVATITALAMTIAAQSNPGVVQQDVGPTDTPASPTLTPTITLTPTPTIPMVTVSMATNCRSGPSTAYDIIGALLPGGAAEVVGKYTVGNYWIIKNSNGGGTCWLWGQYATVTGNTSSLPEIAPPPTPTIALPAAPKSFSANVSCTLKKSGSGPIILFVNNVHVVLSWKDIATNEDGYNIYRNGSLLATLGPDTKTYNDDTTLPSIYKVGDPPPSVSYSIEAFNGAGTSDSRSTTAQCP